jgi:molecular chaperone HtpG
MEKIQFQAESKRLLEMMIHSIYTHREIFLRELISNASDAIDKMYYMALTNNDLVFNKSDYFIKVAFDQAARTLTITDTGIGMNKEELATNLGVIAKSGSLAFKGAHEKQEGHEIIGQFGVGFYSAFMVADEVTVVSKAYGSEEAYRWHSTGADGYTIELATKETFGTEITLQIKPNTEEENYDDFVSEFRLKSIIKKYSDFIRYPIKMDVSESRQKEGEENEWETVTQEKVINSMVPIWRKNKSELTDADYENFYQEKRFGFDKPLSHVHIHADGSIVYDAILYIPENTPYDYYSKEYEKGLELYSAGVLIMQKCADLLPDYFSFVKGIVDSDNLSLNISRELLQHDRQLKAIAKNIKTKIKNQLNGLLKNDREKYETFFKAFGRQLKFGVYNDFGAEKETLQDLLLFYSSKEQKLVTLDEYVARMPEDQKFIYYATGESIARIEKLPQTERVADAGYEMLFLTDDIDEFALKSMRTYKEKEFKSVSAGDLGIPETEDTTSAEEKDQHKILFDAMKEQLGGKVKDVRASKRLKSHPVCLTAEGELSIEMEKVLRMMPNNESMEADKVLEININHPIFHTLIDAQKFDLEKLGLYTNLLYHQALLIEGLPIQDPVAFTNDICKVMK